MKTAFVTGATGFLGLNLIQQLQEKNWEITAFHLPGENLNYLSRFDVRTVSGNILDPASLKKAVPKYPNAVFHLAGDTSMWDKNRDRQYRVNVTGTANVCAAALEKNAERFIHTSSSSAYGYHKTPLTESTPSNALNCGMNYNRTKYLAEKEVRKHIDAGLFAVILNPCNIIGPFDPGNWSQLIINTCRNKVPGYPPGTGTFAHVRDIALAHISAVEKGEKGGNYLLGGVQAGFKSVMDEIIKVTGADIRLKQISRAKLKGVMYLSRFTSFFSGREPLMTFPKYRRLTGTLACDDARAARVLGFRTGTISEMVTDCYQWLKQEGLV